MVGQAQVLALVAALCAPVLGGLGAFWRPWVSIVGAFCAWVGSAVLFWGALVGAEAHLSLGRWVEVGTLVIDLDLRVDLLAATLLLGVHSVGLAAQLYAADFLRAQAARPLRLSSLLSASSALLFCADNYPLLLAGWALLGVGIHLRAGADYAERGTVGRIWVVLRSGDVLLLVGLVALCAQGQVDWAEGGGAAQWIGFCLLLAAVLRSAQFPWHFWLTRVRDPGVLLQAFCAGSAGIYLLLRTRGIWGSDAVLVYTAVAFGLVTALFGAAASLAARDVRPALAYAIASQLGLVLAAMALGDGRGAALHLAVIGVGMGLCLIGVAYLAQAEGAVWDPVVLGRWRRLLSLPFWAVVLGALTVAGIPPLAGAWSYGVLLAGLFTVGGPALWVGGCLLVCVAALCSLRLVFLIADAEEGEKPQAFRTPGGAAQTALIGLGGLAIFGGALGYPPGTGFLAAADGVVRWELLIGPGLAGLAGLLVAWLAYGDQPVDVDNEQKTSALRRMCEEGFYAEAAVRSVVGRPLLALARLARDADALLFELATVELGALGLRGAGWLLGRLQSGQVRFYAAVALLGVVVAFCYLAIT